MAALFINRVCNIPEDRLFLLFTIFYDFLPGKKTFSLFFISQRWQVWFRPKGRGLESCSIHHVGILGKSFTCSCLWRFGVKLRTVSALCQERFWVVADLKRHNRNGMNEWMNELNYQINFITCTVRVCRKIKMQLVTILPSSNAKDWNWSTWV